jgi:hypothetical protein
MKVSPSPSKAARNSNSGFVLRGFAANMRFRAASEEAKGVLGDFFLSFRAIFHLSYSETEA